MKRRGVLRSLYVVMILLLVGGNVTVLRRWFKRTSSFAQVQPLPNLGDKANPIQVESSSAPEVRLPFNGVAATVLFHASGLPNVNGELGILRLISQSSLGQDVGIAVIDEDRPWNPIRMEDDYGPRIHFVKDGQQAIRRLGIRIDIGGLLVLKNDAVVFAGAFSKRYLAAQLWDLQEDSRGEKKQRIPAVGDSLVGEFFQYGAAKSVTELPEGEPILLFSAICLSCGDDTLVEDVARLRGESPSILLPSIYRSQDVDDYLEQVGADSTYYGYFQVDPSTSNLNEDTFLQSFPVVLIIEGGKISYLSRADETYEEVLRDLEEQGKNRP